MPEYTYEFSPEDLERLYDRFQVPEEQRLEFDEDEIRCSGCNWNAAAIYVLASSRTEAEQLLAEGRAGLCAQCYAEMLASRAPD